MVLVDTSVWIDHLRNGNEHLAFLLNKGSVFCHPLIIGELSCGNIKNRTQILALLHDLLQSSHMDYQEVLRFIDNNQLMGKGLAYIDICLLTSAILSDLRLWTQDKLLNHIATRFNINYTFD